MMRYFILPFCLLLPLALGAQERGTISGFVHDGANGEVLIGANVFLEEIALGSATNVSGYYVIAGVPEGEYTLVSTYIGYKMHRQEVRIGPGESSKIDLDLIADALATEALVVRADSMTTGERLFKQPVSSIALSPRQIKSLPQVAEADLLRSLQSLPGILPLSDFSSALYIRGGTPDQNLYMIDGSDVYNPEHAFGIFSTFNTDAIKHVELYKGGFGAEYGGRLSSILDVTHLDGNREEFEGSAAISLLSAKTTLQMPLGQRGSLSGSLRRTYFDQTVARALDNVPDYYFYDRNFKAFVEVDANNKLTLSAYGGRDFLDVIFNPDAAEEVSFQADWGNKTGSGRWTRVFSPRLFGNFWVTGSRFSSDFALEEAEVEERNLVSDLTLKGNLEYHHSATFSGKFGFEEKNLHVVYRQFFPEGTIDIDNRPEHYSAYAQGNWRPSSLWDIEAGLRYNLFHGEETFQHLSPRFAAKYRLSDKATVKGSAGIYRQYLHRIPRFIATDIWTASNRFQQPSTSVHAILGYQRSFKRNYQFEVEGFYKTYDSIYSLNQTLVTELQEDGFDDEAKPIIKTTQGVFNEGDGSTAGFEALMRKEVGAVSGWVGYSLSRTRYKIAGINQDESFSPRHDRTSTVNVVGNVDLKNALRKLRGERSRRHRGKWTLGVNLVYSTGQPFTEPGSAYIIGSDPGDRQQGLEFAPTRINNIRFPSYARLDLSLTYKRQFRNWSMAPYIQIFNVGDRRNVWFVNYEYEEGLPEVDEVHMFPRLPTLGANFEF